MGREKKKCGKDVFEHSVFEPSETQSLREENMLKIPHIAGREEKEFLVHFKKMVFLCSRSFFPGKHIKNRADLWCTVYFGDDIERAGRVENEDRHGVQCVKLL